MKLYDLISLGFKMFYLPGSCQYYSYISLPCFANTQRKSVTFFPHVE